MCILLVCAWVHMDFQALDIDLVPLFLGLRYLHSTSALQKAFDIFSCILPYVFLTEKNQASTCNQ